MRAVLSAVLAVGIDPDRLLRSVGAIGLFLVVFAESGVMIGFFLPGDSLLFTAGLLAATTDLLPPIPIVLVGCFIAAVAGDQVGYMFGRRVGPSVFRRSESRLFKAEYVERAGSFFEDHGPKTIVLARFVPVVRTFAPIMAGVSRMHYRTFVTYNVVGALIWAVGVTGLGWLLGARFPGIGDYLEITIVIVIVVTLLPVVIEVLRHRRKAARAAAAAAAMDDPATLDDQA